MLSTSVKVAKQGAYMRDSKRVQVALFASLASATAPSLAYVSSPALAALLLCRGAFISFHISTAQHMTVLSSRQTYALEVSPPSPCLHESGVYVAQHLWQTLVSCGQTKLLPDCIHSSFCSLIAFTSTAAPRLHVHSKYEGRALRV